MSSKKNIINKNILRSYFEELNLQKHLTIQATEPNKVPKNKKIYLNCFAKDNLNSNQNNINTHKITDNKKKKSFSLYKNYPTRNTVNLNNKYMSLSRDKKNSKIILNCEEVNNLKNKLKFNLLFKDYKSSKKLVSNGSTRKSSDASPNDGCHQVEIANFKNNYKYCTPDFKSDKNVGGLLSKNPKDILKYTSLKKNILLDLKNSHSKDKDKEKENNNQKRKSLQPTTHIAISSKNNCCFLNYNKVINNKEKIESTTNNSVVQKPVPTLKLFDNQVSSSDSDSDDDKEEDEEKEEESDEAKYEHIGDKNMENEVVMDSTFKISDDEISDELNDCDDEKGKHKIHLIDKKLELNNKNKTRENYNKININLENNPKKIGISCKNITTRLCLYPNQNQISNSNKNIISYSVTTKPGTCDEKEKINQDSYLINENIFKQNFNIYGVFDGHGDNGHLISKYISDYMNEYFTDKLNYFLTEEEKQNIFNKNIIDIFIKNHKQIIKRTSTNIDKELISSINYDISQSGSTSVMLFILNDILICSNTGDSECYLFNCSSEDLWTFEALSRSHLASDENEQKRILEQGGEIHPYYDQNGIFEGPDRIYAKNKEYPGLVMSRTFGDLEAKKIGVISEPDITLKKIDNNSKFVVLGSDGLWDVVKPYDIIRIVRPYFNKNDVEGACQTLMKKAIQQWEKDKEERDDITIIIIFIGTPNNCEIYKKHQSLKKIDEIDNDGK